MLPRSSYYRYGDTVAIIVQSDGRLTLPDNLIRDADIAMYAAKRTGYGNYAIFQRFDASRRSCPVKAPKGPAASH
jgi:GGDEF domain-containing protein